MVTVPARRRLIQKCMHISVIIIINTIISNNIIFFMIGIIMKQ